MAFVLTEKGMDELVEYLSDSVDHPVVLSCANSIDELRERIELGYILIKFTDTRGGTELGFDLDRDKSKLDQVDSQDVPQGSAVLAGRLVLNYHPIEVSATIDLETLKGTGRVSVL